MPTGVVGSKIQQLIAAAALVVAAIAMGMLLSERAGAVTGNGGHGSVSLADEAETLSSTSYEW